MNWFSNPCRRHRQCLGLLASGLVSEPDQAEVERHLAECAECRGYYEEIKTATAPLRSWEKHFAHIEPDTDFQWRVAEAIASPDERRPVRAIARRLLLRECWQQLVWPSRHIWAGLAAVWILLLAMNVFLSDSSPASTPASPPSEALLSLQQQEQLLAELMEPDELHAAMPAKIFSPRPSSERQFENVMTWQQT